MMALTLARYVLGACATVAAIAILESCNGPERIVGIQSQISQSESRHSVENLDGYRSIFNFGSASGNCLDGGWPSSGLIFVNGLFYGTTSAGGPTYGGTVYSISPQGSESIVYSFPPYRGGPDGPVGGLVAWNGGLYGTLPRGGDYSGGIVFRVSPTGFERILHNFGQRSDGSSPLATLIRVKDVLYGTTSQGGTNGDGTVFAVNINSGRERVLHSFAGEPDGRQPDADLTVLNGVLYGTTAYGGAHDGGSVFSVNVKAGTTNILYSFKSSPDGHDPEAGLVAVNGMLYGTTAWGGTHESGTVFSVSTSGVAQVLYNFANSPDGQNPRADLIAVDGTLYSTTAQGGNSSSSGGTLYSVDIATGTEQVLHSFGRGTDGSRPVAPVTAVGKSLYGTTFNGGRYSSFCGISGGPFTLGTVFKWRL